MAMRNMKMLEKESHTTVAMVVLCQDYVLVDQEFVENDRVAEKMQDIGFWIDVARNLYNIVSIHLSNNMDNEGYDEFDAPTIDDVSVMSYIIDPANRFELNDLICETIDTWVKHFGRNGKR